MQEELTPEVLQEIREDLERQSAELVNRSHIVRTEMRDRDISPKDSIDESTAEQGTSTSLRLKDRERNLMTKISEALLRMDQGSYGICEVCGDPIGLRRLKARPMTTMCIECKEEEEREERRLASGSTSIFSDFE